MNRPIFVRTILFAAVVAIGLYVTQSTAQPNQGGANCNCNGVVSFLKIFNEANQIQDLNAEIRQKEQDFQSEAKNRQKVIEEKQAELTAFKLGTPDHEKRRKELVRLNIEANTWFQVTEAEIETMKYEWTRLIYEKSLDVINAVARERGFDVVLQDKPMPEVIDQNVQGIRRVIQERQVVYHRNEIDITDEVIKRLNQQYLISKAKPAGMNSTNP